jgi:hypothetical protein
VATFYDDFERADGAPGGNWSNQYGTSVILGGTLHTASGIAICRNTTISDTSRLECTMRLTHSGNGDDNAGPIVKHSTAQTGYLLVVRYQSSAFRLRIYDGGSIFGNQLANYDLPGAPLPYYTLKLIWDNGNLTGWYNGTKLIDITDSRYQANSYCAAGFYNNVSAALDFQAIGGAAVQFTVTPSVVGNYGGATAMTAAGVNTAWTSGTPGSPTFTVDHGTISSQSVQSATGATFDYTPGVFLGTATFTDPSSGLTSAVTVTSDPTIIPIAGAALTQTIVDYLQRSADDVSGSVILNRNKLLPTEGNNTDPLGAIKLLYDYEQLLLGDNPGMLGTNSALGKLWQLINASTDPATGPWQYSTGMPLTELLGSILAKWDTLITGNEYTLGTTITTITGEGVPTIKDVRDDIADLQLGVDVDLSPILDKLDAIRGDTTTSLYTLLQSLAGIRTGAVLSLQDVIDAIPAAPTEPTPATAIAVVALIAALALAAPSGGASVAAAAVAVGAGPILDVATIVEMVGVATEVANLIAAVNDLKNATPPAATVAHPVWPGLSSVTLGSSVALEDGLVLDGPMDGVLVHIESAPARAGRYAFGEINSWMHAGALAVAPDTGDYERGQSFGMDDQILIPQTMVHADSVVIRLGGGFVGTVRKWTVNEPS